MRRIRKGLNSGRDRIAERGVHGEGALTLTAAVYHRVKCPLFIACFLDMAEVEGFKSA